METAESSDKGPSDGELAARVARGDREAAAALVHRHQAAVRSFLRRLCGRPDLADDLAQETLIRLLQHAGQFDPRYPMRTWLFTIARRLWISHGRRATPALELAGDQPPRDRRADDPAGAAATRDQAEHRRRILDAAMRTLTEHQRTAIVLCYQHGLALRDVARVMESPVGTVKSHLHRGRAALRSLLDPLRQTIEV